MLVLGISRPALHYQPAMRDRIWHGLVVFAGLLFLTQPSDFAPKKAGLDFPYEETFDTAGPALSGRAPFGLAYDFSAVASKREVRTDFNSNTNTASGFPFGIRQTNNYFAEAGINLRQHLLKDFWSDQDATTISLRRKDLNISREAWRF